jgi:hypothetical protein
MLHPRLAVRTMASGLTTPTSLAFLGPHGMFVLEKNTGRVLRVVEGVVGPTVLDLAVNFASERGLLGVALHPDFPHIHLAPAGTNGPIVVPLFAGSFAGTDSASGCVENVDRDLIKAIRQDPSAYYVNVHSTPDFPGGAIRGQLSKVRRARIGSFGRSAMGWWRCALLGRTFDNGGANIWGVGGECSDRACSQGVRSVSET